MANEGETDVDGLSGTGERAPSEPVVAPSAAAPSAVSADDPPPAGDSFWKTGLGILTQLAILAGAVAGILAAIAALTGSGDSSATHASAQAARAATASAADVERYRQAIIDQCRAVNTIEQDRSAAVKEITQREKHLKPIIAERDWLLRPLGEEIQATNHVRAELAALRPPPALAGSQESVQGALKRLLGLLIDYRQNLKVAGNSYPKTSEVFLGMEAKVPDIKDDQMTVTAGLERLGGPSCDIQQPSDDTGRVLLFAINAG